MHVDLRDQIRAALSALDHVLPGQAPLRNFVHHNTLHGFQHLPFDEAIASAKALNGLHGYLPTAEFLKYYQQGRITDHDIAVALQAKAQQYAQALMLTLPSQTIYASEVLRVALLHDLEAVSPNQFAWQIEELQALCKMQPDVPARVKQRLLQDRPEAEVVNALWETLLRQLELEPAFLHPENMLDLSLDQAESLLAQHRASRKKVSLKKISMHEQMVEAATKLFARELLRLGEDYTLRTFLLSLTGVDILDCVRPEIIRICGSALDEGVAAWTLPNRAELGLYAAWRAVVSCDINPFLQELPDWQAIVADLPATAEDAIIAQLLYFGIPAAQWPGYLRCLALEIPGWSGMINWREQHPDYQPENNVQPTLADYLAIRLILDRLWLNQICRDTWQIEATLTSLQTYFRKNRSEFMVRSHLFRGDLPEYLIEQAEAITLSVGNERFNRTDWQYLADIIWTWQINNLTNCRPVHSVYDSAWRLFRLCQHLAIAGEELAAVSKTQLEQLLRLLADFTPAQQDQVWLYAYEYHYRENLLHALQQNHTVGRWQQRHTRPEAQIIFCIDDREEGFRRHLEEVNPNIETLGAAGFFGLAINYKGLDAVAEVALCPVVIKPQHAVHEVAAADTEVLLERHQHGQAFMHCFSHWQFNTLRRNVWVTPLLLPLTFPWVGLRLLSKVWLGATQHRLANYLKDLLSPEVPTRLIVNQTEDPELPQHLGFSDTEQAERVLGFLRNCGLLSGFADLVVLMGHGSHSQNNAHLATYDCGACSGRHGGPNARAFAQMANRPEIRRLLAQQGLQIPERTWFIGAEHNTCNEDITWFDLQSLPLSLQPAFQSLKANLQQTSALSAHERCRRMASAPRQPTPTAALKHVQLRAVDFSQPRPELGHATKAALLVGRRSMSQGLFLDRRALMTSYDASLDPEGTVLTNVLAAVIPVGAGINLEYYFSAVNPEGYGCGTKALHNIQGLFAVMQGGSSDLRTGLPQQMTEIHEAMRLQIVVEAKVAVLEKILQQHALIQEFVMKEWVYLNALDPETGEMYVYQVNSGFLLWEAPKQALPAFIDSVAYYAGHSDPMPPVFVTGKRVNAGVVRQGA